MSTTISIEPLEAQIVLDILASRVGDRAVFVYGSRARRTPRRRSDLDLAFTGQDPMPLSLRTELADAFDASDLPYRVDLLDLATVAPEFRELIEKDFVPIEALKDLTVDVQEAGDLTPDEERFDKLREECGVMAIYNHFDAARMTYWGLYALQHRGQESAGIATADGMHVNDIKGMGLVSEIFTDDVLAKLPGHIAIGHTRYSTTGDSALLNAQPISVESTKG